MSLGLPSSLTRWENAEHERRKRSWKWIKTKTHTYRISVDEQKRMKRKTMTENIAGACACSMRTEFNLRHNVQFYRFLTFLCGQSKTHQNSGVNANWSMREFYVIIRVTWRIIYNIGAILRCMLSFYKAKTWYWNWVLVFSCYEYDGHGMNFFQMIMICQQKIITVSASWWSCLIFSS